jgi:hypothetical protein
MWCWYKLLVISRLVHAILCAAMRSCFGGSTVPDEWFLYSVELSTGAEHAAIFLWRQLRGRVGAPAHRAPKHVITIPIAKYGFRAYFQFFQEFCLWSHENLCNEIKNAWYSPYFQVGESLSWFETFNDGKKEKDALIAASSLAVLKAGEICVLLPPFLTTFKQEKKDGNTL